MDTELLDGVIQRIFTAGILLRGTSNGSTPAVDASIEQAINELDKALDEIRAAALAASTG